MGTWGTGVFENDHTLDLYGAEVERLAGLMDFTLALEPLAFDDLEGPLLYVHMLSLLAEAYEMTEIDRGVAEAWKAKYLDTFTSTIGTGHDTYVKGRRAVIAGEFASLIARLPEAPEAAKQPPKKRSGKTAAAKKTKKKAQRKKAPAKGKTKRAKKPPKK